MQRSAPAAVADSGSAGMKVEVRPPRFVDQQQLAGVVHDALDRREVGGDAVVRRRHDVDRRRRSGCSSSVRATVSGVTQ